MGLGSETGLRNWIEDVTPQAGGPIDVNGFAIVSTANGNIVIQPDGSGVVTISSDVQWPDSKGPVLGDAQDYSIEWDSADAVHTISTGSFVFVGGSMGVGEAAPLGRLHVLTADTGFGVSANADELVLENDGHCGVTIISAASSTGNIYFGDANVDVGRITYNHSGNEFTFYTADALRVTLNSTDLDVVVSQITVGANSTGGGRTDATRKLGRMFSPHYTNAEESLIVFVADSDGSDNILSFGDGTTSGNKPTIIRFTVGATDTEQGSATVSSATVTITSVGTAIGDPGVTDYAMVSPTGVVTFNGASQISGLKLNITTQTDTDYTALVTDDTILVSTGAVDRTITLPAASTLTGKVYNIKKIDAGAGKVTLDPDGTETVDGDLTPDITAQYESFTIQSDGSNWHVL